MYFGSKLTSADYNILRTSRTARNRPFSTPVEVSELNEDRWDATPVLSKDGLEIFFGSTRTHSPYDIFHATRASRDATFEAPTEVIGLSSSSSDEYPNWLSPDRCQLMFSSDRAGGMGSYDIWIATRPR